MTRVKVTSSTPGYLPERERPKCRKCGATLKADVTYKVNLLIEKDERGCCTGTDCEFTDVRVRGWGYGGGGLFCTLRCGYEYGCAAVRNRER